MMKKYTLFLAFFVFSFCAFSAQLNPFAYGLRSELSADQSTLTVHYSLNAPATGVKVLVMNGNTVVAEKDCNSLGLTKGNYTTTISTTDFPTDTDLTWKVEVKGASVAEPTVVSTMHSLYHPSSIDIDNNPNSDRFGTIFCIEGLNNLHSSRNPDSKYSSYVSYGSGAGLYLFDASFTHQKTAGGANGYNGGVAFGDLTYSIGGSTAYAPRRVRLTKDGRIFISTQVLVGSNKTVLWEVTSFQEPWKHVMAGNVNNCTDNAFYAAPNVGFDVYGSGNNLKLAMLSGTTSAFSSASAGNFRLSTYSYNGVDAPVLETVDHQDKISGTITVAYDATQVEYDNEGGFWLCQGRGEWEKEGEKKYPSLIHFNKNGNVDLVERRLERRGGGIAYNRDYSQIIISGEYKGTVSGVANYYHTSDCAKGKATVYSVTSTDAPSLAFQYSIDMTNISTTSSSKGYCNINDFAWDYAGNVYAVSHIGEKIAAWAMPYSGKVETPAATKYAFEITKPNYDNPENHLAPFAYDLCTTTTGEGGRTKLHFMLNAHARRVQVWLIDEETKQEILLRDYPNEKSDPKDFVPYHPEGYGTVITTEDVEALGLKYGKNYSWRVDVWGKKVAAPNCVKSYSFYHPSAVDIDNNPENPNFGMILTNECQHDVKTISGYMGTGYGAGIYAFTADFKPVKNADEQYGFNGGNVFTTKRADDSSKTAYAPRRIRISDDGRIFVTSLNTNGKVLWEVSSSNLNNWTEVISGNRKGTTGNDVNAVVNASATYLGGPNIGFDVRGSESELRLIMLSGSVNSYYYAKCHEYNLGRGTQWNISPSKTVLDGKYIINHLHSHVTYDQEGGVWFSQYRSAASDAQPSLVHINANGNEDFKEKISNRIGGGFRFNHDFSKVIIADPVGVKRTATIYTVSKDASGKPVLTEDLVVDMSLIGSNLNDFAWDYAGNLYACGNSNEKVAAYVMPRSAEERVSTPAREEYMVNLTQPVPRIVAYNLTYRLNGANQTYDFSFYVNTKPNAGGVIKFYKNDDAKTFLYEYSIVQDLIQGDNTVSIPMATLDAVLNYEKDITWELTLSAPESNVFGKIYKSGELNTAYATINTNPATDYFGHVYAGNQQDHVSTGSGGNIYVWAPGSGVNNNQGDRYHTIKTAYTPTLSPNNKNGFTQVSAPGIAPDGKVYFTDNGKDGGVYVMDPKDYSITSFFKGLEQNGIAQYEYNSTPVGTPSSSAHIYWTGGNTAKLFLVSTEYDKKYSVGSMNMDLSRYNAGYYIYPLTEQDGQWTHDWGETQRIAVTEDNIYQPNFTIVGTSHGAWYCQHRRNDWDVKESRSLMFFDNNGNRTYCSTDEDVIYGSCGSGIAVNKEENLLAMASGLGGIMFFEITWNGDVPTLTHKYSCALNYNDVVTTLNFDYNNNLVATVGDSYNDNSDKHRMVVFTMPDMGENTVTVPARFSQRVAALYADERMKVHFDREEEAPYQTVDVFRQLQAGMYNTICLPFSLESLDNTPWKGFTVMKFDGTEYDATANLVYMNFSEVDFAPGNIMEAGMPYLIWPKEDVVDLARITPVWRSVDFTNQGRSVEGEHATFKGVIDPTYLEVDPSIFFLVANNRLAVPSAAGEMMGMRAYFQLKQPLGDNTKAVIAVQHKTPTGVEILLPGILDNATRKILQDQQIYIIRDGKIYNILGESVKTNEFK